MLKIFAVSLVMAVALAGGLAPAAQAGSLMVTPVIITLDGKTHIAALTIKNENNEARVIQTELLRWTQKYGADVETPSRDMVVNPPMATLQPGQTQTVRIGLKRSPDYAQELAYRLYVTEVPSPSDIAPGLHVALRLSIPVYVSPIAKANARLWWQAARDLNGTLLLTVLNDGNRHLRVNSFTLVDAGSGRALGTLRSAFTLLAGQARRFSLALPGGWLGTQLNVLVQTADGPAEVKVMVPRPAR